MTQYTKEFFEKISHVEKLAKEKHGEYYLAAIWGSAQCFLTEENLKVMENVFGRKEI